MDAVREYARTKEGAYRENLRLVVSVAKRYKGFASPSRT